MSDTTNPMPALKVRYFHTDNASREWYAGKARVRVWFKPYAFTAGALRGVCQTDDPAVQSQLAALACNEASLTEISEAEYWNKLTPKTEIKSAASRSNTATPIAALPPVHNDSGSAIAAKAGEVVAGSELPEPLEEATGDPVTVEAAMQVGDVSPAAVANKPRRAKRSAKAHNPPDV